MSVDNAFTVTRVRNALQNISGITKVNVTEDGAIFEAHPETPSKEIQSNITSTLEIYKPTVSKEKTSTGEPYYKIEITGLINNQ